MMSGINDFFVRHRKKFIVTGALVGGTYIAIKFAQRKLNQFQEAQAREYIERARRFQHFDMMEKTCNQVIAGMSEEGFQAIIQKLSTEQLVEQLRNGDRSNRVALWEEMKIIAFTRLTTMIYASSMLAIVLRVKMNILGGYVFRDTFKEKKQEYTNELKQQYLSLVRYFLFDGGLSELIQLIRAKVLAVTKALTLSKRLNLNDIEQLFWSLQMAINSDPNDPISKMAKYLVPPQLPEAMECYPVLKDMYNDTLDLLESNDAANICSQNVCRGFSFAIDAIADRLSATEYSKPSTSAEATDNQPNSAVLNINNLQVPLAKLIPIVSMLTANGYDEKHSPQNFATTVVTGNVLSEKGKTFGANIYESACAA